MTLEEEISFRISMTKEKQIIGPGIIPVVVLKLAVVLQANVLARTGNSTKE